MDDHKRALLTLYLPDYKEACLDYWTDAKGHFRHDEYTGNDEYGNRCAGPSEVPCPICPKEDTQEE